MEIIYRANDGCEFTNKQDCINYENRANCLCDKKHFIAFDSNLEPYDITSNNIEDTFEMMEYFVCLTDEAIAAFKSMCEQTEICAPMNGIKVLTYYGWEVENPDQWTLSLMFIMHLTNDLKNSCRLKIHCMKVLSRRVVSNHHLTLIR